MDNINIAKEIRSSIKQGDIEKVRELISTNEKMLNYMTPFGTWLHVAAAHNKIEIVKYFVNCGIDVNIKDDGFNKTAIEPAAANGHKGVVKYLLDCGAELDVSEPDRNPLFATIYGGYKDIVELLVERNIDITIRYTGEHMKNMDAYDFAIERGQKEIASFLKNKR